MANVPNLEDNRVIQDHLKVLTVDLFNRFLEFNFDAKLKYNAIMLEYDNHYYNFHVYISFYFSGSIMSEMYYIQVQKTLKTNKVAPPATTWDCGLLSTFTKEGIESLIKGENKL